MKKYLSLAVMFVFFGSAGISIGGSLEDSALPNLPTMKEIRERLPAKAETVIKAQAEFCNRDTAIIDFEVLSPWRYIRWGAIYADDNVWGYILKIRIKKIHCQNLAPENSLRSGIFTTLLTNHIFKKEYRTGDRDIRRLIRLTKSQNTNGNLYFEPNYNERIPKDLGSWLKLDRGFRENILNYFSPYPEKTAYGITLNEFSIGDGNPWRYIPSGAAILSGEEFHISNLVVIWRMNIQTGTLNRKLRQRTPVVTLVM